MQITIRTLLYVTLLTEILLTALFHIRQDRVYSGLFGGAKLPEQRLVLIELAWGKAGLNDWVSRGAGCLCPILTGKPTLTH